MAGNHGSTVRGGCNGVDLVGPFSAEPPIPEQATAAVQANDPDVILKADVTARGPGDQYALVGDGRGGVSLVLECSAKRAFPCATADSVLAGKIRNDVLGAVEFAPAPTRAGGHLDETC